MEEHKKWRFDIQMMGEGAAGAANANTGIDGQDAAGSEAAPDLDAEFDGLVKGEGKYREIYGKRVQKAVHERMKGMRGAVDKLNSLGPALEIMAARYGMAPDDPKLAETIARDQSLLEDMALRNNRDTQTEWELAQARAQTAKAQDLLRQMLADQDMQRWKADAEEMATEFPDFNLEAEMQDPRFQDLLKHNVTMKGAYMALHPNEVVQQTVKRATKSVTDSVAAGKNRPRENGIGSQAGAAMGKDPMQMSRAEYKKWEEAVLRGERVSFSK